MQGGHELNARTAAASVTMARLECVRELLLLVKTEVAKVGEYPEATVDRMIGDADYLLQLCAITATGDVNAKWRPTRA